MINCSPVHYSSYLLESAPISIMNVECPLIESLLLEHSLFWISVMFNSMFLNGRSDLKRESKPGHCPFQCLINLLLKDAWKYKLVALIVVSSWFSSFKYAHYWSYKPVGERISGRKNFFSKVRCFRLFHLLSERRVIFVYYSKITCERLAMRPSLMNKFLWSLLSLLLICWFMLILC